ncbi:unnamed protein product [Phytomonas sp. Hart1]|nr:unnamed protein product [Phytomonas sp. Hart1]|eukprot:CCW69326.1 unnamed protein product [Phytomonas sp. isolate Hart1]
MEDLRIFDPFPELKDWFERHNPMINVQTLDSPPQRDMAISSPIPYLCILYHAFKRWRERAREDRKALQASDHLPFTAHEYKELRGEVESMAACLMGHLDGSFSQAVELCTVRLNRPAVNCPPGPLQELFDDPRCADPLKAALHLPPDFFCGPNDGFDCEEVLVWFVIQAIRAFYNSHEGSVGGLDSGESGWTAAAGARRVLPFCGYVPDMNTTTKWYRELCEIYHRKFSADVQHVTDLAFAEWRRRRSACVSDLTVRRPSHHEQDDAYGMLHALAEVAVKNIWSVRLVRFSPDYVVDDPARDSGSPVLGCEFAIGNESTTTPNIINLGPRLDHVDIEIAWRLRLGLRIREMLDGMDNLPSDGVRRALCFGVCLMAAQEWTRCGGPHFCGEVLSKDSRFPSSSIGAVCNHDSDHFLHSDVFYFLKLVLLQSIDTHLVNSAEQHQKEDEGSISGFRTSNSEVNRLSLPSSWDRLSELLLKICLELERVGLSEVISVAASVGAIASQEVVKLIQRQRIPAGHPLIYNGYDNIIVALKTPTKKD